MRQQVRYGSHAQLAAKALSTGSPRKGPLGICSWERRWHYLQKRCAQHLALHMRALPFSEQLGARPG